jgi:hypothetical protein
VKARPELNPASAPFTMPQCGPRLDRRPFRVSGCNGLTPLRQLDKAVLAGHDGLMGDFSQHPLGG